MVDLSLMNNFVSLTRPVTRKDTEAILDEILSELDNIHKHLDDVIAELEGEGPT